MPPTYTQASPKSLYFYGPKSFLTLALVGFGVVALPLTFALIYGAIHVDRLATQSQTTVYKAVRTTQHTRMLLEQLTAMERTARQYRVLRDDALFQAYAEKHQNFQLTVNMLLDALSDPAVVSQLNALSEKENQQFLQLSDGSADSGHAEQAIGQFITLTDIAQNVLTKSNQIIDDEVAAMHQATERTLKAFLWFAFSLGPAAVVFAGLFVVLLNRPIKQIDQAIRRLGGGEFSTPVTVTGPRDMEYLGQRIEWLRQQLVDLERQKTKFIRHVSHELKTPLTALREGAELLADEVVGGLRGEQKEVVSILQQNSIKLQKLIEDLLNFNIAATPQSVYHIETLRLDDIVTSVTKDHKLSMVTKDIRLKTDIAPASVEGEAEKLRVIVDNLLSNAVKYSPHGGTIRLTLREQGKHVILDVCDSGPGIDSEESSKIFEAFYQGKAPVDGYIKGSGLGLSIAREHALAHRGRIEAIPDAHGAHLRVILPHKQADHVHAA